jgi:hypothetical protein
MSTPPKVKTLKLEVLKPEAKSTTVVLLDKTEAKIIREIAVDQEACERHSKLAVYAAIRIGLRLVLLKQNSKHGDMAALLEEHLPNLSRASCYNYMRITEEFLKAAKLRHGKTQELNTTKLAPLLKLPLAKFASEKSPATAKPLMEWVGERGLTQIYRDLSSNEAPTPPVPTKGGNKTHKPTLKELHDAALKELHDFLALRAGKWWKHLDQGEIATLITNLNNWEQEAAAFTKGLKTPAIRKASDTDV